MREVITRKYLCVNDLNIIRNSKQSLGEGGLRLRFGLSFLALYNIYNPQGKHFSHDFYDP